MRWDYSLADLIMFTPEVYLRLFSRFNEAAWPLHLLALLGGLAIPFLLSRPLPLFRQLAIVLLALAWIYTGLGFLLEYYSPINWPVTYFAYGFVAQAMLIGAVAGLWHPVGQWPSGGARAGILWLLWLLCLFGLPWLTASAADSWQALSPFAMTPDVTVVATLPGLLLVHRRVRWLLLLLPLGWCFFSAATLLALGTTGLMMVPALGLVAGLVLLFLPSWSQSG